MTSAPLTPCINEALPEEVLGVIFEEHAKLDWKAPLIDGQVCRQWQQTILRSPRAWARLDIAKILKSSSSKLYQWLDRSGSVPLYIKATNHFWDEGNVLDQHHRRIKSLEMSCYSESLAVFENRSFPILQSLNIRGQGCGISMVRWRAWRAVPELRSLRVSHISVDTLQSNTFPSLRDLALYNVEDCDCIIRNSYHSLTSLMLSCISLQYTSETLEFPSLKFLSLFEMENLKHRMNVPALTTYHESWGVEKESFPMPLPLLIEYGVYGHHGYDEHEMSPPFITRLHQHYPNISRLSIRARPFHVKPFFRSLCDQPTALPMLRIFAVGAICNSEKYSKEDKHSMRYDAFVRNMASSVKMELCFVGRIRVPLYFGHVSMYINEGRSELTSTLRTRVGPVEASICSRFVS